MKQFRLTVLAFILILAAAPFFTRASHIVGVHITYQYLGTGQDYLFKLKLYRDCSGIPAPVNPSLNFKSPGNCSATFSVALLMDTLNSGFQVPFNSCAASGLTTCNGGALFAYQEYNYYGVATIPPCGDWIVSYTECCRNAAITNLVNSSSYSSYVETRMDNLNYSGNSSPVFNAIPVNYYCAGIPAIADYSAYDPDGDSLSYEFTDIYTTGALTIPFSAPYTYDQPLATFTPTVFDAVSGQVSFHPSAIQISVIGMRVNEYRNGVLIGSVRRDDEIVVVSPIANPDTIAGTVYYDINNNLLFDSGDLPASAVLVKFGTGTTYCSSQTNGKYMFQTSSGTFPLTIPNPPLYTTSVPASYSITAGAQGLFLGGNDFALQPIPGVNDLEVYLTNGSPPVPGANTPYFINYKNSGSTTQTNVDIQLTIDTLVQFVTATPAPSIINGNQLTWTFPVLDMFSSGIINITLGTDTLATIGDTVHCYVDITGSALNDTTPLNNSDAIHAPVVNSFDPNTKAVSPEGELDYSFVQNQNYLNYTIRFQNLGTAPANLVRVMDILDYDLDIGSIEYVASSKPCLLGLTSPNILTFTFHNANLPPASWDEPGSKGFVEFRVKTKNNLAVGAYISNSARIYFDYNAAVYTNTVYNFIVAPTSVQEQDNSPLHFALYPNPAGDQITFGFDAPVTSDGHVEMISLHGKVMHREKIKASAGTNSFRMATAHLPSGLYLLRLTLAENTVVKRFIKQ